MKAAVVLGPDTRGAKSLTGVYTQCCTSENMVVNVLITASGLEEILTPIRPVTLVLFTQMRALSALWMYQTKYVW